MSVTDQPGTTTRRRDTARAAKRRSARARPDPPDSIDADDLAGLHDPTDEVLPPGRRDASGFWIPEGYETPTSLFSPHQRRLQEKQRQAHRARRAHDTDDLDGKPPGDPDDGGDRVDSPGSSD